jgi:signal transduction histidine kinase/phage shock protein PspC (stress-responsive transcriptional regulator)
MGSQDQPRQLRRDPANGRVGGVLAGLAARFEVDPLLLRVGFVVAVVASGGIALLAYTFAWALIPAEGDAAPPAPGRRIRAGLVHPGWRVAAGAALLALSGLLVFRELGIWWSDELVWPLVLAAAGATVLWRQARSTSETPTAESPTPAEPSARPAGARLTDLYRGGFGVALVIGAALLFLSGTDSFGGLRDVVVTGIVALLALALILAPLLWRLGRNLAAERAERIRSQERADLAAHLHDSVLQTLALVQKRADDPRAVATLARRQERELRRWLFDNGPATAESAAAALRAAAAEVEDAHGVQIDVVAVGDRPVGRDGEALTAAAREAMTNAAKFAANGTPIAVYAEFAAEGAQVYVRDRGPGFDPASTPADRRGVRESIVERMNRHGGTATIRSSAETGTEVELRLGPAEAS